MKSLFQVVVIILQLVTSTLQQINLAANGSTKQSSAYPGYYLSSAIDNDLSSCAITAAGHTKAWWMITFASSTVYITYVSIVYRPLSIKRFAFYSLHITNSTVITGRPGGLCYQHDSSTPNALEERECYALGKNVIVYNEGPSIHVFMELCDVKIYGCYKGWSGINCTVPCPKNCIDNHCFPTNGTCVYGCNIGFAGQRCDEYNLASHKASDLFISGESQTAALAFDGDKTSTSCIRRYGSTPMLQVNLGGSSVIRSVYLTYMHDGSVQRNSEGHAVFISNEMLRNSESHVPLRNNSRSKFPIIAYDVSPFVIGQYVTYVPETKSDGEAYVDICEMEVIGCPFGKFGKSCNQACPDQCRGICDLDMGLCVSGCKDGWMGSYCNEACRSPNFGKECKHVCRCKDNLSCNHISGACPGGCQEGWTGLSCDRAADGDTPNNAGVIVGAVVGGVFVIILCIAMYILLRRKAKNKNKKKKYKKKDTSPKETDAKKEKEIQIEEDGAIDVKTNVDFADEEEVHGTFGEFHSQMKRSSSYVVDSYESGNEEKDNDNFYGNVHYGEDNKFRISVSALQAEISLKKSNNGFETEYEILPKGLMQNHGEGSKDTNKEKNRFLETWPYDHSRVILKEPSTTDYINASYIDSCSKSKAYIATQGPKKCTIKQFWYMIWQENVEVIVMLTNLVEGGKVKCEKYWPENTKSVKNLGAYKLFMAEEKEHSVYIHRILKICNKTTKCEREVHQFHFTHWSDHGVPDKVKLVTFYRKVKRVQTTLNGPFVVHCSAGVGRTGTFIAIDALYEEGQKTGYVDVMEYVQIMRKDRMNMVQSKNQYTAIFECLLELFTVPEQAIATTDFLSHVDDIQPYQSRLKQEFQKLNELKPAYSAQSYKSAKSKENAGKNVVQNILPHDDYRPNLVSFVKPRNNYINAVIIPDFCRRKTYIVTQYPLKDTVVDFWTMVYDHNCSSVVLLQVEHENVTLWPEKNNKMDFDRFNLKQNTDSDTDFLSLSFIHKEKKHKKTIGVFSDEKWKSNNIPTSITDILDLLKRVATWRNQHPGSIAIVCRDGCSRSGLFVTLGLTIEKIEKDHEVDIFQVVRSMQIRRPEFLSNIEQYEFCYECIKRYLEGDDIYTNAY